MWLSLLLVALIIAITLYQSLHGLFSTLIMLVLTICCVALSFGTHEWVAVNWLSKWRPDYAFAISLGVTFGVPLLVLRVMFDKMIQRSPLLPALIDRLGAGLCGLVTALLMTGMLAIALQMVPFDRNVLSYARFDLPSQEREDDGPDPTPPDPHAEERELWLTPDRFAAGFAGMLSDGVFSGERRLSYDNPDIVQAIGWVNLARDDVARYAPPQSVSVVRTAIVDDDQVGWYEMEESRIRRRGREQAARAEPKFHSVPARAGHGYRMLRVKIANVARDKFQRHAFTLRQFRLVGEVPHERSLRQFFPIALQSSRSPTVYVNVIATRWGNWPVISDVFQASNDSPNEVEVVFELPTGFKPVYLAYKQGAVTPVAFETQTARGSRADTGRTAPRREETVAATGRGGRSRKFTTRVGRSMFGNSLPIALTDCLKLKNADSSRGMLSTGHLVGTVADQGEGSGRPISKFRVPHDKRLLHLNVKNLQAKSLYGQIKSKAITTVQNFIVYDADGRQYKIIGKYSIAVVNGEEMVEIQYFPDQAGTIGGVGEFSRIKDAHLKTDYDLVFLFLVEPGAKITHFTTGGSSDRRDDLGSENLIAPD